MALLVYCALLVVVFFTTTVADLFSSNVNSSESLITIAHDIKNWTVVTINSSKIVITSTIKFVDLQGVTIDGQGGVISCRNSADSGLAFVNVDQLILSNVTIMNCGTWAGGMKLNTTLGRSAILIAGCTGVTVTHIHVRSSMGSGLLLLDAIGNVTIKHSMFSHNVVNASHYACAGLHLELSQVANSSYHIEQCVFANNSVLSEAEATECREGGGNPKYGNEIESSGGLVIFLRKNSTKNKIIVCNSAFRSNTAPGLGIIMDGSIFKNTIKVANTSFSDNQCEKCSGGGASIVWQTSRKQ